MTDRKIFLVVDNHRPPLEKPFNDLKSVGFDVIELTPELEEKIIKEEQDFFIQSAENGLKGIGLKLTEFDKISMKSDIKLTVQDVFQKLRESV